MANGVRACTLSRPASSEPVIVLTLPTQYGPGAGGDDDVNESKG